MPPAAAAHRRPAPSLQRLAEDALLDVLCHLSVRDLLAFERTGKAQLSLVRSPRHDGALWKWLYARLFPLPPEHPAVLADRCEGDPGAQDSWDGWLQCRVERLHRAVDARCRGLRLAHAAVDARKRYHLTDWRNEVLMNSRVPNRCVQTIRGVHKDELWVSFWSPDGRWLMAGSKDKVYSLHRLVVCVHPETGVEVPQLRLEDSGEVQGSVAMVDWAPDSSKVAFSLMSNHVQCYDVASRRLLRPAVQCRDFDCHARWCSPNEFLCGGNRSSLRPGSPAWHDLKRYGVVEQEGGQSIVLADWTRIDFAVPNTVHCPVILRRPENPDAMYVSFSTGGLWSGQNWRIGMAPLSCGAAEQEAAAGDGLRWPDSRACLAAAAPSSGPRALLPRVAPEIHDEGGPLLGSAASSSGRHLAMNFRPFADGRGDPLGGSAYPLSTEMVLHLWNLDEGKIEHEYHGHKGYSESADPFLSWPSFSPFSPHIATGSEDCGVYVYNVNHEDVAVKLRGHTKLVNCVSWHPKLPCVLASAGDDSEMRLWGIEDAKAAQHGLPDAQEFWASLPRDSCPSPAAVGSVV